MKRIVLFGDSLTQYGLGCERAFSLGAPGWGDRLVEVYSRRADVLNRGCTLYNTRAALATELVPSQVEGAEHEVLFATVWFGANDSCDPNVDKTKHVPLEEYERNLRAIAERASKLTSRIIFLTPPPINAEWYRRWRLPQVNNDEALVPDRKNPLIQMYADACKRVAAGLNAPCLDVFNHFHSVGDWDKTLISEDDGLHLSGAGDKLVFDLIMDVIRKTWPEIAVHPCKITKNFSNSGSSCEAVPPRQPFWDKIDTRDYRRQLGEVDLGRDDDDGVITWPSRPAFVFVGDSITQQGQGSPSWCQAPVTDSFSTAAGWGDLVAARYSRRVDVYNRGLAGYNSKWCLAAFESLFPTQDRRRSPVELVTIFFGANDAADAALNPVQHVSLVEFESNVEELVRRCKNEWDARRIVVIGCPPIDRDKYLAWRRNRTGNENKTEEELTDRTSEVARRYSLAAERVANKHKTPFIDVFDLFGLHPSEFLSDGLHLSPKGNRALGQKLLAVMDERWPELKCVQDPVRRRFGFQGSTCHAFAPEQPWFMEINWAELTSGAEEVKKTTKPKDDAKDAQKAHKRVKL